MFYTLLLDELLLDLETTPGFCLGAYTLGLGTIYHTAITAYACLDYYGRVLRALQDQ
jgi:hypothetical protein